MPGWRDLFGFAGLSRYSRANLQGRLADTATAARWKTPAPSVLGADIACLVSMYAPGDHTAATVEDTLSNPFRNLHLVDPAPPAGSPSDGSHLVTVHRTAGRRCPAKIQAYASLDYAARTHGHAPGSISLSRLGSDPIGPGRLLLTGTAELRHTLRRIAAQHPDLAIVQSADGEELLVFSSRPDRISESLLAAASPSGGLG